MSDIQSSESMDVKEEYVEGAVEADSAMAPIPEPFDPMDQDGLEAALPYPSSRFAVRDPTQAQPYSPNGHDAALLDDAATSFHEENREGLQAASADYGNFVHHNLQADVAQITSILENITNRENALLQKNAELKQENDRLQKDLKKYQDSAGGARILDFEHQVADLASQVESLMFQLAQKQIELTQSEKSLALCKHHLGSLTVDFERTLELSPRSNVSDDEIEEAFTKVHSNIRSLVQKRFFNHPKGGTRPFIRAGKEDAELRAVAETMSPTPNDFLKSDIYKEYFVEGVIWQKLMQELLIGPVKVFDEDFGKAFQSVVDSCKLSTKQDRDPKTLASIHYWRELTGLTLSRHRNDQLTEIGTERVEEIATSLSNMLIRYANMKVEGELEAEFGLIVQSAVKLATSMATATPYYKCYMGPIIEGKQCGFAFNEDTMNQCQALDGGRWDNVVLVVSPALFKRGNSSRENYDQRIVMKKSNVIY